MVELLSIIIPPLHGYHRRAKTSHVEEAEEDQVLYKSQRSHSHHHQSSLSARLGRSTQREAAPSRTSQPCLNIATSQKLRTRLHSGKRAAEQSSELKDLLSRRRRPRRQHRRSSRALIRGTTPRGTTSRTGPDPHEQSSSTK